MNVREAYVSYAATDFDATGRFFTQVLGLERVIAWDRPDGRGAYFGRNGIGVVEISGAPLGEKPLAAPPEHGFAVTLMVEDLAQALAEIEARAGIPTPPVISEEWGRYAELPDPDGVLVYVMERLGPSADEARTFLERR